MRVAVDPAECRWRGPYVKNVERVMAGKPPVFDGGGTLWKNKCYMPAKKCPVCGRMFNASPRQVTCSHFCSRRRLQVGGGKGDRYVR